MPLTKPEEIDGEEAPEPPEPSDPKTEVTDREVAVETDAVAGETLREALESQATLREQVGGDVFPSLARLKEENDDLRDRVSELYDRLESLQEAVDVYELPCGHFVDGEALRGARGDYRTVTCATCGNGYQVDAVIED
jgi:hypothetical protein